MCPIPVPWSQCGVAEATSERYPPEKLGPVRVGDVRVVAAYVPSEIHVGERPVAGSSPSPSV